MTIAEATLLFLDYVRQNSSPAQPHLQPAFHHQSLMLLADYFSPDASLTEITPSRLRDFLSRWYVEESASKTGNSKSVRREAVSQANRRALNADPADQVPNPQELLNSLSAFFEWADRQAGTNRVGGLSPIIQELRNSLPRALEITQALSNAIRERGGAFNFPEFLTSFEEGGSSQYDIDVPGKVGAIDGYFRILRVEGSSVEAVELISEERVWPIVFPSEVAERLDIGYVINLELVRNPQGWLIAGCGFAYPPGTDI